MILAPRIWYMARILKIPYSQRASGAWQTPGFTGVTCSLGKFCIGKGVMLWEKQSYSAETGHTAIPPA